MLLDGKSIYAYPSKEVARRLGLLPQSSIAPDGITVADLVARGRYPHQRLLRQWTPDRRGSRRRARWPRPSVADLADRPVDELSGGQRQRVWLAMALAQQTPILLLDEPTTFLDIAHQIEMLDLCADLQREQGRTLVAVLHDLNHACRYATHLIAMRPARSSPPGDPPRSSPPSWSRTSSGWPAGSSTTRRRVPRWSSRSPERPCGDLTCITPTHPLRCRHH